MVDGSEGAEGGAGEGVSRETSGEGSPIARVIAGAVSAETAYVVPDYPYGFRLRCAIRYWIETTTTKHGARVVSQTTNPKRGGIWNRSKASTYSDLRVLYVDEQGHVQNDALSFAWVDEAKLDAFVTRYAAALADEATQKTIRLGRAVIRARRHVKVTIREAGSNEPPQSREEQARIMRAAVGYELRAMGAAEKAGGT
jgi:hypothetical protein